VEYGLAEDKVDQAGMAIWARANEKARRLALIYACSADHADPRITVEAARWACEFVDHQTRRMLFMSAEYVAENDFDARCKKLVATLRKWREKHCDACGPPLATKGHNQPDHHTQAACQPPPATRRHHQAAP